MSLPRRGSRRITVDGVRYRWRLRRRPTADQRTGQTPLLLAVAAEDGDGPSLIVRLHRAHPGNEIGARSEAVTPREVAGCVREGLAAGWRPRAPGRPHVLEPRWRAARAAPRIYPPGARPPSADELAALARGRATLDVLRLDDGRRRVTWPGGGGFQPCGIVVNGRDLIDMVQEAERAHVDRELAARRGAGEALDPDLDLAGQYMHLSRQELRLPSRHLLGAPSREAGCFAIPEDDPRRRKTTLLQCTCGISECWFLLATITALEDFVIWSDFEQFHRDWVYGLGPLVFARDAYLAAIAAVEPA